MEALKKSPILPGLLMMGGCLLVLLVAPRAHALPVTGAHGDQNATLAEGDGICTQDGLKKLLGQPAKSGDIELLYQHCRAEFLERNALSASVKQVVDEWVGTDLSRAEPDHIFLVYELVMTAPRPTGLSEQFERDCRQMGDSFQNYWDTMEPLTSQIDINLGGLLGDSNEVAAQADYQERELFNFVQYSQFCRSLLDEDDVEADDWIYKVD